MINKLKLEISCVHCLNISEKNIFPIINGQSDFASKQEIMDEELFLYYCPHCGHYQTILYECLYYDPKYRFALILSPRGLKLLEKVALDLSDYRVVEVDDIKELKEKIIIYEHCLDALVVEKMKKEIKATLTNKASYDLFLQDNNGLQFVLLYPDNEIIKTYPFIKEDYDSYLI